eukprot:14991877-Ditylum_brightwellii.AAC.1
MTQHKEECGEDEEGNPETINGGGDDEDSGEETGNEEEVGVGKNRKDADEASLKKNKVGEYVYETIVDHRFENGILNLKVRYHNKVYGKDNVMEVPFEIIKKDEPNLLAQYIKREVNKAFRIGGTRCQEEKDS